MGMSHQCLSCDPLHNGSYPTHWKLDCSVASLSHPDDSPTSSGHEEGSFWSKSCCDVDVHTWNEQEGGNLPSASRGLQYPEGAQGRGEEELEAYCRRTLPSVHRSHTDPTSLGNQQTTTGTNLDTFNRERTVVEGSISFGIILGMSQKEKKN